MKHCHNCKHLEWVDGDWISESAANESGWTCNKRGYLTNLEESRHLRQLSNNLYRYKGKRCWEPK